MEIAEMLGALWWEVCLKFWWKLPLKIKILIASLSYQMVLEMIAVVSGLLTCCLEGALAGRGEKEAARERSAVKKHCREQDSASRVQSTCAEYSPSKLQAFRRPCPGSFWRQINPLRCLLHPWSFVAAAPPFLQMQDWNYTQISPLFASWRL